MVFRKYIDTAVTCEYISWKRRKRLVIRHKNGMTITAGDEKDAEILYCKYTSTLIVPVQLCSIEASTISKKLQCGKPQPDRSKKAIVQMRTRWASAYNDYTAPSSSKRCVRPAWSVTLTDVSVICHFTTSMCLRIESIYSFFCGATQMLTSTTAWTPYRMWSVPLSTHPPQPVCWNWLVAWTLTTRKHAIDVVLSENHAVSEPSTPRNKIVLNAILFSRVFM